MKHPNIVRMFDVIDTEKYIGIVLEFAGGGSYLATSLTPGGELFDHILASRYLREKDAQKLFAQLVSGVDYLHKKHIVHRDLKLENLLLDKHRNVIITDFGFANKFDHTVDDLMATSCGSPCYAAPELVVSEGLYVGSAVDIWSCGVILYAMLSGYLPYDDDPANPEGDNINLLYKYIMSTKLNFPDHMSAEAKHLLQIMLVPNPDLRCSIEDIMAHPWLESHRELFVRTPADHEYIFQENMYRKSQTAKRELADRRRVQQEGKLFKAMQRSQSTLPGATTSLLDQGRRAREQRHHSAMPGLPGTSTMPEYLGNAGHRTPPLSAYRAAAGSAPIPPAAPLPSLPSMQPPHTPSSPPMATVLPVHVEDNDSALEAPPVSFATSITPPPSTVAVENEMVAVAVPRPVTPPSSGTERKPPLSGNKNRHTIQVEYDVEASYEKMKQAMDDRGSPKTSVAALEQGVMDLSPASDVEMESDLSHEPRLVVDDRVMASATPEASHIPPMAFTPPASTIKEIPVVPEMPESLATPTKKGFSSPATPRVSSTIPEDEATPQQRTADLTPRPPSRSIVNEANRATVPPPTLAQAVRVAAVPPPKQGRSRKGLSMDRFGIAKLLGQSTPEQEEKPSIPAPFVHSNHVKRGSMSRPPADEGHKSDKKSRRRTLQLMVNRSASHRDEKQNAISSTHMTPATPLAPLDLNPGSGVKAQPSPPVVVNASIPHPHAVSTASIATVDDLSPQNKSVDHKHASSSAAKKVMDWFRRKSLAKDTLTGLRSAGVRSDSTSSFVRVSDSPVRGVAKINTETLSSANLAMSSTSSLARTAENTPAITMSDMLPSPEPVQGNGVDENATTRFAAETSLAPTSTVSLAPPVREVLPGRSQSHHPRSPAAGPISATATLNPAKAALRTTSTKNEDSKMRVHTGVVDQSALSSQPPTEVMQEVLKVLHNMGIEVKRENEYRFRCTRIRRKKAGPTTGLGISNVMSYGSGMSPLALMSSSMSKVSLS